VSASESSPALSTCAQTMVTASHCVGLTFPGMMELPGSLAGRDSSPMPQRGPLASMRRLLAMWKTLIATRLMLGGGAQRKERHVKKKIGVIISGKRSLKKNERKRQRGRQIQTEREIRERD
jgi:hypothetical protein